MIANRQEAAMSITIMNRISKTVLQQVRLGREAGILEALQERFNFSKAAKDLIIYMKSDKNRILYEQAICLVDTTELFEFAGKTIDISVAKDGECNPFDYATGVKVKIQGSLTFRKRDDNLYYNLSASNVEFDVTEEDSIKGTMYFRGTLGGKEIIEKKGKKGAYRILDAYSSEKVDENNYAYTWVHFVDFTAERPSWLMPKTGINADGELELSVFNVKENINCRVTSLSLWDKQNPNQ